MTGRIARGLWFAGGWLAVAIGTVGHEKKEEAMKDVDFLKATFGKGKVVEVKEEKKDK